MHSAAKTTTNTEQSLVEEVRKGNKEAFETLFFRYHPELCSLAAKIVRSFDDARDVVQDVFLRIWRSRETWHVDKSVKAYLYQAVWNEALNAKKKRQSQCEVSRNFERHVNLVEDPFEQSPDTKNLVKDIWEIVSNMPKRRRFVFSLHRKHGLSYKEIVQVMDITRKTVENHMGLALKEIRNSID
jgi:RNA polymerase sigma-70 factor (ECF subfamily)